MTIESKNQMWSQNDAIEFARLLEDITPFFGYHVALTGGCLYKDGTRKDCDIVLYQIRQAEIPDKCHLFKALANSGVHVINDYGFCIKCRWNDRSVDILIPEHESGNYEEKAEDIELGYYDLYDEIAQLKQVNVELLEGLQEARRFVECFYSHSTGAMDDKWDTLQKINDVITKAKEKFNCDETTIQQQATK